MEHLEERAGKLKMIPLDGNARAVVVRTDDAVARKLRAMVPGMKVRGKEAKTVLTSGSIGKLKRRASGSGATGVG